MVGGEEGGRFALRELQRLVDGYKNGYGVLGLSFLSPEETYPIGGLTVIGDDEGTLLAVDLSGRVVLVDGQSHAVVRYVNDSIASMMGFLELYDAYTPCDCPVSEEQQFRDAMMLKSEMAKVDGSAFDTGACWWSIIIAQVRDGQL